MMKKILVISICALMLCSCSNDTEIAAEANTEQTDVTTNEIAYDYDVLQSNLSELNLYGDGIVLNSDDITQQLLLDADLLKEHFVYKHSDPMKSTIFMMLLPKNGNEDKVKTDISAFLDMYKSTFDLYAPEELALVEDYYTIDKGDYIIYTVSEDNQAVINAVNRSKK